MRNRASSLSSFVLYDFSGRTPVTWLGRLGLGLGDLMSLSQDVALDIHLFLMWPHPVPSHSTPSTLPCDNILSICSVSLLQSLPMLKSQQVER